MYILVLARQPKNHDTFIIFCTGQFFSVLDFKAVKEDKADGLLKKTKNMHATLIIDDL